MSAQVYESLFDLAGKLGGMAAAGAGQMVSAAQAVNSLKAGLDEVAEGRLAAARGAKEIRIGATARLTAIELDPAAKALQTASTIASAGSEQKIVELTLAMARKRVVTACALALELPQSLSMPAPAKSPPAPTAAASRPGSALDLGILRNIATYHREHERFYTCYKTAEAAEIFREANRLKTVATVWLDENSVPPRQADFADPRFQAAGCEDLNALRAIASIGVLFMEGEQEPAEIRGIKAKLAGLGPAWAQTGNWLADKMESAWVRESVVLRDDSIAAAEHRFGTIVTNWRGSRQMELSGRCLELALQILQGLDLRPAAVRADRQGCGRRLLDAAWVMDLAAQIKGRSACDLSENEVRWTGYLDLLRQMPQAAA